LIQLVSKRKVISLRRRAKIRFINRYTCTFLCIAFQKLRKQLKRGTIECSVSLPCIPKRAKTHFRSQCSCSWIDGDELPTCYSRQTDLLDHGLPYLEQAELFTSSTLISSRLSSLVRLASWVISLISPTKT
jgi:hypothetical protein